MQKALLALCLLAASNCACASVACSDAVTTDDLNRCALQNLNAAETRLSVSLARAMRVTSASSVAASSELELAQRSWTTFRSQQCEALRLMFDGGRESQIQFSGCLTSYAKKRASDLEDFSDSFD